MKNKYYQKKTKKSYKKKHVKKKNLSEEGKNKKQGKASILL